MSVISDHTTPTAAGTPANDTTVNPSPPPTSGQVTPAPGVNGSPALGPQVTPAPGVNGSPVIGGQVTPAPGVNGSPALGPQVTPTPGVNGAPPINGQVTPVPGVNPAPPPMQQVAAQQIDPQTGAVVPHVAAQVAQGGTTNPPTTPTTVPATAAGSAQQVASTAPASIQSFGATPQVGTTYANAATVDPNSAQAYLSQYQQAFNTAMAPQYQQQQAQLQEQLRARGISSSGAAGQLQTNLLGQQAAATASGYEPLIGQAFGYNQADLSQNAANQQAANSQNANASNSNANANANYYANDVGANYNAYNQYLNSLFGAGQNEQASLLSAYLNSFGANTGVTNAMSQGLAGQQAAYQNAYSGAQAAQGQALSSAFGAAGTVFGRGGG